MNELGRSNLTVARPLSRLNTAHAVRYALPQSYLTGPQVSLNKPRLPASQPEWPLQMSNSTFDHYGTTGPMPQLAAKV